ncbi:DMT family transporter [Oryzibacter oryziterrae]|uniref:DMT family transporter n=1 Tax=Oryzibacter oryziterrae TaxID=2766474 RepID=UPI001F3B1072|nr:DMT family transporter [Oryzibacter oryziterrae]
MVSAGLAFAVINVLTQWVAQSYSVSSTALAFWQYGLSLVFFVPSLIKLGAGAFKTSHPILHVVRVVLATLGVQFFVAALTHGVPIWQVIAIDMTSPFMVILGARLFLGEHIGFNRAVATAVGFVGGMLILAPWSDAFSVYSLLPLGAALMWAGSSIQTRQLATIERPESVTVYLLALLTPINAVFLLADTGFSPTAAFVIPTGPALYGILVLAALTAAAQYFLTLAYSRADASYLQPFDHVRLPLGVVAGYLVFGYAPGGFLWVGAALIIGASLYLLKAETGSANSGLAAAE